MIRAKLKYISIGLAAGLLINNIDVVAENLEQIMAYKVKYPIMVNGNKLDSTVLNYENSTYLPLKAIGEALGTKVLWNQDKGQVEIGNGVKTEVITTPSATASPISTVTPSITPIPSATPIPLTNKQQIKVNSEVVNKVAIPTSIVTSSPTPTPIISNSLKDIDMFGLDADVYFIIGGKKYKSYNKIYFPNDKDNKIYIAYPINPIDRFTNSSQLVLNAIFNEPIVKKSDNPSLDGLVSWEVTDKYSSLERKFIDAKTCYLEGYLYNKDKTKSYYIKTKADDLKGVVKSSMDKANVYVPVEDLYNQLGIQCTITYNKKDNELLFNIVK